MISGSDLYGFPSKDSDVDLRGIFVYTTDKLLGLDTPRETIELKIGNLDIVLFEIKKALSLAYKGNSNVLEHIFSKQIYSTPEFLELKEILVLNKKGIYNSYKGLSTFNYKKFILKGRKNTVKKFLYVLRGLMAGIYALEVGKIEPNLEILNKQFKIPEVKILLKLKREGKENDPLPSVLDTGKVEEKILELFQRIDKAYTKTNLREPSQEDRKELSKFLLKIRKKYLDS